MYRLVAVLLSLLLVVGVHCLAEQENLEHGREREREHKVEHGRGEHEMKSSSSFKLDERSKEKLLEKSSEDVFFKKSFEYFLKNRANELECFSKFRPGESLDFVIDLAPCPSMDKVDKMVAESPMAFYLERHYQTPARAYFSAVQLFIESVTYGLKPEVTHSIIYDNDRKYFIRGESVEKDKSRESEHGDFSDVSRNLKTMWPESTNEVVSPLSSILENKLGLMTKIALWNRDNGLPTVLRGSKRSKAAYTVVITDGASGAKLSDLTDDLERTTVIDIGNHRFVKNLSWDDMNKLISVYTLPAPQWLAMLIDTTRMAACRFSESHGSRL